MNYFSRLFLIRNVRYYFLSSNRIIGSTNNSLCDLELSPVYRTSSVLLGILSLLTGSDFKIITIVAL